jgi:predicted transposase/invertase (TIGR01784 family)
MEKKNSPRKVPAKTKRRTAQIFDRIFKRLMHLSPAAVVHFINGLFGTGYPPDSGVSYLETETVSRKLRRLHSDILLMIGGHAYHVEAQTGDDAEMIIRVFEYAFAAGLRAKTVSGNRITVNFPASRVIYLKPTGKTPDVVTLNLRFPDGKSYDYKVKSLKLLDYSVEDLEQKNLILLLPFYVLKLEGRVRKAKTSQERRKLSGEMREILETVAGAAGRGERNKIFAASDKQIVTELLERLFQELYMQYTEFKETHGMMVRQGMLLTYSEEAAIRTERRVRKEEREKAEKREREEKLQIARNLKQMGLSDAQIASATGLSPEDIQRA